MSFASKCLSTDPGSLASAKSVTGGGRLSPSQMMWNLSRTCGIPREYGHGQNNESMQLRRRGGHSGCSLVPCQALHAAAQRADKLDEIGAGGATDVLMVAG